MKDEDLEEIAEILDMGFICFYHRPSGTIESYPDPDHPFFEPEPWQETIDKVEEDIENYLQFEQMGSSRAFRVMEKFAQSLDDGEFKEEALERLLRRKPFRNFKDLIESSQHRDAWFEFQKKEYIDFVREQIEEQEEL